MNLYGYEVPEKNPNSVNLYGYEVPKKNPNSVNLYGYEVPEKNSNSVNLYGYEVPKKNPNSVNLYGYEVPEKNNWKSKYKRVIILWTAEISHNFRFRDPEFGPGKCFKFTLILTPSWIFMQKKHSF